MAKVVECPSCGATVREDDEQKLIETVQGHAREAHGMELSEEQVLSMARPA